MNTAWWVQRWSELQPDKPAIIFEGETITYAQLNRRANRASCWLQEVGIEKGDRVAVLLDNCPEFFGLYLATSRIGALCVPLNFRLAPAEIDFILKHSRPRLFVYASHLADKIRPLSLDQARPPMMLAQVADGEPVTDAGVMDYREETAAFDGKTPFSTLATGPADPEEPHVIMYTSGTTGQPKGAVLSHRKTFFNCLNAEIFFKLKHDDVMLVILPLFHSGGLFIQASPCLYKGATMVLHRRFDPQKTYRDIEQYRATKLLGVPTVYRALLNVPPEERGDVSSLEACAIGGEQVTPKLLAECKAAGFAARQIMGQTETSILLWASEEESLARPGTVGRPVFHAEVRVVDNYGQPVTPGEVGEIVARGEILMKEYWHDPAQTEQAMQGGWLKTGDLARVDVDGYFYLMDRARDLFISGGENVYPAEVERALASHPAVAEAAVVGMPNETWGEVGVAYVILNQDAQAGPQELMDFCAGRLARYKVPKRVNLVEDLPRTPVGKVRKFLLREQS